MFDYVEPGGVWNEPGGNYFQEAMELLGVGDEDLEEVRPEHERMSLPVGDYPVLDRVYAKAWELREGDEG